MGVKEGLPCAQGKGEQGSPDTMSKPDYFLGGQGADIEMHKEVKKSRTHSGDKAPCPRLGFSPFLDVLAGVGGPKVYTLEHIASKVFSSYSSNL